MRLTRGLAGEQDLDAPRVTGSSDGRRKPMGTFTDGPQGSGDPRCRSAGNRQMAATKWEYLRWAFLDRPRSDRTLYRAIKRHRVRRVVEFGIGSVERATRILKTCERYAGGEAIAYAGLDWFEERPNALEPLKLIDAHRRLKATGAEVLLMPGGPVQGLPAVANSLGQANLLLFSPEADDLALEQAWFYLPRMLAPDAVVLRGVRDEENGPDEVLWNPIDRTDIECRARAASGTSAAA